MTQEQQQIKQAIHDLQELVSQERGQQAPSRLKQNCQQLVLWLGGRGGAWGINPEKVASFVGGWRGAGRHTWQRKAQENALRLGCITQLEGQGDDETDRQTKNEYEVRGLLAAQTT